MDSIPAAISKDKPGYPYRARRMNVTGFVEIRFLVNKKGRVEGLEIIHDKPAGTFAKSVREAVMRWRFNPGIKNNRSVATWMTTTINFELNRKKR
ncbi:MAG TPA: energy transducer TonB [Desulfocapsa sulfexigens]|nr:energy transducer TonB [Desulfocapsa sulfexigens]